MNTPDVATAPAPTDLGGTVLMIVNLREGVFVAGPFTDIRDLRTALNGAMCGHNAGDLASIQIPRRLFSTLTRDRARGLPEADLVEAAMSAANGGRPRGGCRRPEPAL